MAHETLSGQAPHRWLTCCDCGVRTARPPLAATAGGWYESAEGWLCPRCLNRRMGERARQQAKTLKVRKRPGEERYTRYDQRARTGAD